MQVESEHWPEMQASEQHSVAPAQLEPAGEHWTVELLQVFVALSHTPEQQSDAPLQIPPNA